MKHIARKRFGQNFLTDGGIIDAIVRAIDPRPGQPMVEIGPGLAALEHELAGRAGRAEPTAVADEVIAEAGRDPAVWLPLFHKRRRPS